LFAWCKFWIVFIPVTDLVVVMHINYYYYYYYYYYPSLLRVNIQCESKKVAPPLKLFAIFSLRLSVFP